MRLIVTDKAAGQQPDEGFTLFDGTGIALQGIAVAAHALRRAEMGSSGQSVGF